jgi:hypothetical protein
MYSAMIAMAALLCPLHAAKADSMSTAAWCKKGLHALDRGAIDTALGYFGEASAAGLSRDSLYYFLSKAYILKGAYDTALAFNFGMKPSKAVLVVRQLKQRSTIYAALGWKEESDAILDSLLRYREYRQSFFVPEILGSAGFDYEKQEKKAQPAFPYLGPVEKTTYVGPGYGGNLRLHWAVPAGRNFFIEADAFGSAASMYYRPATSMDSMNLSWGGNAGLVHTKSGLSLDYSLYRVVDYEGEYSTQNSIGVSRTKKGRQWLTFLSCGYGVDLMAGLAIKDQTFWLTGYFDRAAVIGKGFSALVNLSGYFAPPVITGEDFRVMYVDDVTTKPVQHYYVDFQANAPTTNPISIGAVPFLLPKTYIDNSLALSAHDLFGISETGRYPRTYLSLSPQATFRQPLIFGFDLVAGAGVTGDYYPEKYRWTGFNIEYVAIDTAKWNRDSPSYYIAYNKADGRYYWVKALDNIGSGEQYGGPIAVDRHEKLRLDAEGLLSLSLRRNFRRLGTFSIGANVSRNFSTLRAERFLWWQVSQVDAPFSMPAWSYGLTLNWNFVFSTK